MGDLRFNPHYTRVRQARDASAVIRELADDEVVSALAAASSEGNPYLSNILATEAMNRMHRARVVTRSLSDAIIAVDVRGRVTVVNPAAARLIGREEGEILGADAHALLHAHPDRVGCPTDGSPCPLAGMLEDGGAVMAGDVAIARADGTHVPIACTASPLVHEGTTQGMVLAMQEIAARRRAESLLAGQKRVLECIAKGTPLSATLDVLLRVIEANSAGLSAGILLAANDGSRLVSGAGPNLPPSFSKALESLEVGDHVGPCSTAAHLCKQIIMSDIATDTRWPAFRDLALDHGYAACWSTPIRSSTGRVLGTFALYYGEPRPPTDEDQRLIEVATHLAGIAIERDRMDREVRASARELEERVQARTHDLRLANEELEAFTYLVSHDLKEPVRAIEAYLQALTEDHGDDLPAQATGLVDRTLSVNERLASLLDSLLEFSRASRIDASMLEPVPLRDALSRGECSTRYQHALDERNGRLIVDLPEDVHVRATPAAVCQVIGNLVLNAVKHNGSGTPHITITGGERDARGEFVDVQVRDNGPGFPQDVLTRFNRGGPAALSEHASLHHVSGGFGLTIVQRVAERLGGSMRLANTDEGAIVHLRLPAA